MTTAIVKQWIPTSPPPAPSIHPIPTVFTEAYRSKPNFQLFQLSLIICEAFLQFNSNINSKHFYRLNIALSK